MPLKKISDCRKRQKTQTSGGKDNRKGGGEGRKGSTRRLRLDMTLKILVRGSRETRMYLRMERWPGGKRPRVREGRCRSLQGQNGKVRSVATRM